MDNILVRAGRPLRIHFDTTHLLDVTIRQLSHKVEQWGGVVVHKPESSDVLVVHPSHPWVFGDFLKARRPELRPSTVLAFWISLCLTTQSLVWVNSAYWPYVHVPLERPAYPDMPAGVFAWSSFLAGITFSKLISRTDSTNPNNTSRQRDRDTPISDMNSAMEASQELQPGTDSDEDVTPLRRRSRLPSRLQSHSDLSSRASPAVNVLDVSIPDVEEAEVSAVLSAIDPGVSTSNGPMAPAPSLPDSLPLSLAKEAPLSRRHSPMDVAPKETSTPRSAGTDSSVAKTSLGANSAQLSDSTPVPAPVAMTTSTPIVAPAPQPIVPGPQYLVVAPPAPETPDPGIIIEKSTRSSATAPGKTDSIASEQAVPTCGNSAPQPSKSPAPVKASDIPPPVSRASPLDNPKDPPPKSNDSSAVSKPLSTVLNTSSAAFRPSSPPHVSTISAQQSVPPQDSPAPTKPLEKPASSKPVVLSTPKPTTPKTPAPLVTSSTGLKYRREPISAASQLALGTPKSSNSGALETIAAPTSANKPKPRPKMRPVPAPDGQEPKRPALSISRPTSPTKLLIRLDPTSVNKPSVAPATPSSPLPAPKPTQSFTAVSATPMTKPPTSATLAATTTIAATPKAAPKAAPEITLVTRTPSVSTPSSSQDSPSSASAPTPGSTVKLPKKLIIRSPTLSTVPPPSSQATHRPGSSTGKLPVYRPPPVPPTPTPEQLNSKRPLWTPEEDQYIIDYMNWAFAQDRNASSMEIMKEIAVNCPYRSVKHWQNRFTAKEDSIYMQQVPVLFERLTNRTSGGGRSKVDDKQTMEILSGTRTRNRKAVDYGDSSDDDGERRRSKRARTSRIGGL